MARIDPSRQVSMVGSSKKIRYWAKRPNIPRNIKKDYKPGFPLLTPADFILKHTRNFL